MPTNLDRTQQFRQKAGLVSLTAAVGVVAVNRNRDVSASWIRFCILRTYSTYFESYMHACNHLYKMYNCTAVHSVYPVFSDWQVMS